LRSWANNAGAESDYFIEVVDAERLFPHRAKHTTLRARFRVGCLEGMACPIGVTAGMRVLVTSESSTLEKINRVWDADAMGSPLSAEIIELALAARSTPRLPKARLLELLGVHPETKRMLQASGLALVQKDFRPHESQTLPLKFTFALLRKFRGEWPFGKQVDVQFDLKQYRYSGLCSIVAFDIERGSLRARAFWAATGAELLAAATLTNDTDIDVHALLETPRLATQAAIAAARSASKY